VSYPIRPTAAASIALPCFAGRIGRLQYTGRTRLKPWTSSSARSHTAGLSWLRPVPEWVNRQAPAPSLHEALSDARGTRSRLGIPPVPHSDERRASPTQTSSRRGETCFETVLRLSTEPIAEVIRYGFNHCKACALFRPALDCIAAMDTNTRARVRPIALQNRLNASSQATLRARSNWMPCFGCRRQKLQDIDPNRTLRYPQSNSLMVGHVEDRRIIAPGAGAQHSKSRLRHDQNRPSSSVARLESPALASASRRDTYLAEHSLVNLRSRLGRAMVKFATLSHRTWVGNRFGPLS